MDTGSDYSFIAEAKVGQLGLHPSKVSGEEVEIAGGQSITIAELVPNVAVKMHTLKSYFIKPIHLRVMPMRQVDLLLGKDFLVNTLNIRSDLSITTKKGEQLLPWTSTTQELEPLLTVPSQKCLHKSSLGRVYLVQGHLEDKVPNDASTNQLERDFWIKMLISLRRTCLHLRKACTLWSIVSSCYLMRNPHVPN